MREEREADTFNAMNTRLWERSLLEPCAFQDFSAAPFGPVIISGAIHSYADTKHYTAIVQHGLHGGKLHSHRSIARFRAIKSKKPNDLPSHIFAT